jgi:hypothetical protein
LPCRDERYESLRKEEAEFYRQAEATWDKAVNKAAEIMRKGFFVAPVAKDDGPRFKTGCCPADYLAAIATGVPSPPPGSVCECGSDKVDIRDCNFRCLGCGATGRIELEIRVVKGKSRKKSFSMGDRVILRAIPHFEESIVFGLHVATYEWLIGKEGIVYKCPAPGAPYILVDGTDLRVEWPIEYLVLVRPRCDKPCGEIFSQARETCTIQADEKNCRGMEVYGKSFVTKSVLNGTEYWRKQDGRLHREGDLPAIVLADGSQKWYRDDKLHREGDQPAVVHASGSQEWYRDGKHCRDGDRPAVVQANGYKAWYRDGKYNREGDKPSIILADGTQEWHRDDYYHRDGDLPAVVCPNGYKAWYKNGKSHREGDLPAIIYPDGTKEWYRDGKSYETLEQASQACMKEKEIGSYVVFKASPKHEAEARNSTKGRIFGLAPERYRKLIGLQGKVLSSSRCYGDFATVAFDTGSVEWPIEALEEVGGPAPQGGGSECPHEFVNVGFTSVTMACRHCGIDMEK